MCNHLQSCRLTIPGTNQTVFGLAPSGVLEQSHAWLEAISSHCDLCLQSAGFTDSYIISPAPPKSLKGVWWPEVILSSWVSPIQGLQLGACPLTFRCSLIYSPPLLAGSQIRSKYLGPFESAFHQKTLRPLVKHNIQPSTVFLEGLYLCSNYRQLSPLLQLP